MATENVNFEFTADTSQAVASIETLEDSLSIFQSELASAKKTASSSTDLKFLSGMEQSLSTVTSKVSQLAKQLSNVALTSTSDYQQFNAQLGSMDDYLNKAYSALVKIDTGSTTTKQQLLDMTASMKAFASATSVALASTKELVANSKLLVAEDAQAQQKEQARIAEIASLRTAQQELTTLTQARIRDEEQSKLANLSAEQSAQALLAGEQARIAEIANMRTAKQELAELTQQRIRDAEESKLSGKSAEESFAAMNAELKEQKTLLSDMKVEKFTSALSMAQNGLNSFKSALFEIKSALTTVQQAMDDVSRVGSQLGTVFAVLSGYSIGNALSEGAQATIDYAENLNLFTVAFKDNIDEGEKFLKVMSDIYALDPSNIAKTTGTFYEMGYAVDMPADAATKFSTDLTKLTLDLSSLFNYDFETSADNLASGIRGMSRAVLKYGLDIRASTVEQYAMSKGIEDNYETMNEASKEILRYLVILEQSTDAQSDFAKTVESPANQLRVLKEQLYGVGQAIGNFIVQPLSYALPYLNAFVMVLKTILQIMSQLLGFTDWLGDGVSQVGDTENLEENLDGVAGAATGAQKAVKALLAPFDELNVLSENSSSSSGVSGIGTDDVVSPELLAMLEEAELKSVALRMKAVELKEEWLKFFGIYKDPITLEWKFSPVGFELIESYLKTMFPQWAETIASLFDVDWTYVFTQLQIIFAGIKTIIGQGVMQAVELLLGMFNIELTDEGISGFIEKINEKLNEVIDYLITNQDDLATVVQWIVLMGLAFTAMSIALPIVLPLLGLFVGLVTILSGLVSVIKFLTDLIFTTKLVGVAVKGATGKVSIFTGVVQALETAALALNVPLGVAVGIVLALVGIIAIIVAAFVEWITTTDEGKEAWSNFTDSFMGLLSSIRDLVLAVFDKIKEKVDSLSTIFAPVFDGILTLVTNIIDIFTGLIDFITGVLTGDWEQAWDGLATIFYSVFAGIANACIFVMNTVRSIIDNVVTGIVNGLIDVINFFRKLAKQSPIEKWDSALGKLGLDAIAYVSADQLASDAGISTRTLNTSSLSSSPSISGSFDVSKAMQSVDTSSLSKEQQLVVNNFIGGEQVATSVYDMSVTGSAISGINPIKGGA